MSSTKCSSVGADLAESQRAGDRFRRWLPVWLGGQGTLSSFPVDGIPTPETCAWTGHLSGALGFRLRYTEQCYRIISLKYAGVTLQCVISYTCSSKSVHRRFLFTTFTMLLSVFFLHNYSRLFLERVENRRGSAGLVLWK